MNNLRPSVFIKEEQSQRELRFWSQGKRFTSSLGNIHPSSMAMNCTSNENMWRVVSFRVCVRVKVPLKQ